MPIILPSGWTNPASPVVITGVDGVLTARVDATHGSVLLEADFSALGSPPKAVLFMRGGDRVRSGDLARAPGGFAVACDLEAPVGAASTWTAHPVSESGTVGAACAPVSITLDAPPSCMWIKSIVAPHLSMPVWHQQPSGDMEWRADGTILRRVPGSPYPGGSADVLSASTSTWRWRTETLDELAQMRALLAAGAKSTLLMQVPPSHGQPDMFCLVVAVGMASVSRYAHDPAREWTVDLVEVRRPATADAPLYIPGRSFDDALVAAATWDASLAMWPTYVDAVR